MDPHLPVGPEDPDAEMGTAPTVSELLVTQALKDKLSDHLEKWGRKHFWQPEMGLSFSGCDGKCLSSAVLEARCKWGP